jgi:NAD(P)-dependent dehydrogenase (short-subunit alcohol dehydrogenase family)
MSAGLFSVAGKNVLITGGSRGIGLMIAKGFVQAGANVCLTSRDETACAEAAASIHCHHYVASNVSSRTGCEALATHIGTIFDSKLDVLINNAGTSWGEPLDRDNSRANWGWDKVLDLVRYVTKWNHGTERQHTHTHYCGGVGCCILLLVGCVVCGEFPHPSPLVPHV